MILIMYKAGSLLYFGTGNSILGKKTTERNQNSYGKTLWQIYDDAQLAELDTLNTSRLQKISGCRKNRERMCDRSDPHCRKRRLCRLK